MGGGRPIPPVTGGTGVPHTVYFRRGVTGMSLFSNPSSNGRNTTGPGEEGPRTTGEGQADNREGGRGEVPDRLLFHQGPSVGFSHSSLVQGVSEPTSVT